ncbi:hypothetical protein BQ8482_430034 [Mesorhizobium delmotii]|uniref:Uncharacterized protein n=1 Tax=Mesorhizobium delmotii TaxID=1631247 RepID=A0A2P9ATF2_9HYPH|nr:hypothetical protein BQ8482_430034 [Mesorhizobium delmotii]
MGVCVKPGFAPFRDLQAERGDDRNGSVYVDAHSPTEGPLLTFRASKPQVRQRPKADLTVSNAPPNRPFTYEPLPRESRHPC